MKLKLAIINTKYDLLNKSMVKTVKIHREVTRQELKSCLKVSKRDKNYGYEEVFSEDEEAKEVSLGNSLK